MLQRRDIVAGLVNDLLEYFDRGDGVEQWHGISSRKGVVHGLAGRC